MSVRATPLARRGLAVCAGILALAAATPVAAQDRGAALVQVDAVIVEPMTQTTPLLGRLVAREAVIATQVAGTVFRVHADIGDRVERNDLIAELDPARLQSEADLRRAERDEAAASVEAAAAGLASAEIALERLSGLQNSAAFSQARFDEAELEVRRNRGLVGVAEARRARAEANWVRAMIDLDDADIRAPFSGVVSDRSAHVGEFLRVGDPVVTLINDTDLEIEAAVPTDRLAGLLAGTELNVVLDDGTRVAARVRASVPLEDNLTRTRLVRLTPDFGATEKPLAGNQSVTVLIPIGVVRDVLTVHKDAVLTRQGGTVVFAVIEDKAEIRPVRLGTAVGNRFEVIDGLSEGDLVTVRGNERLRPGQPVRVDGDS
ncbi:MAG: efflux RND transporter periplasmic adaptor subunit [Inquilinus sp.]|nr:efflux RND transporter periplasmic adaptor subunit [Inquilinus sp.]